MTPAAVEGLVGSGAIVIDVREQDEWLAGHAPESHVIPMSQVEARVGEFPTDRPAVILCRSGGRSNAIAQMLSAHGIDAVNVAGGMRAWEEAGLPVVSEAGGPGRII